MQMLNKIACKKFIFKLKPKHTNFEHCNYNDASLPINFQRTQIICAIKSKLRRNFPRKSTSLNPVRSSRLYTVQNSTISLPLCDFKMGLQEVGWGGMDWITLAEERDRRRALADEVMNLRFP
jgi:hypothetical protein